MTKLYLISPPSIDLQTFPVLLEDVLKTGAVTVFQLRLKPIENYELIKAIKAIAPICRKHNVTFILNDRPDLAAEYDCDGAHIGNDDGSYREARGLLHNKILGVSCYNSFDTAIAASDAGADYVAFGALFPTTTKQNASMADLDRLKDWSLQSTLPCVGIGGITLENVQQVIDTRADFIAVSSAIWQDASGAAAAAQKFGEML